MLVKQHSQSAGANGSVTPIAFLDGSNQEWDTKGGIEFGTQDGRFDGKYEYYAEAKKLHLLLLSMISTVAGERTINSQLFGDELTVVNTTLLLKTKMVTHTMVL